MKKVLMTLAAVLCCAMTTTVLTSCNSDSSNDDGAYDKTPKYMMMQFDIDNIDIM